MKELLKRLRDGNRVADAKTRQQLREAAVALERLQSVLYNVNDDRVAWLVAVRSIGVPCEQCKGTGVKVYGSTAMWRGGIGGAAMTAGPCDKCWGSGDADRPWADLRRLEAELKTLRRKAKSDERTTQ